MEKCQAKKIKSIDETKIKFCSLRHFRRRKALQDSPTKSDTCVSESVVKVVEFDQPDSLPEFLINQVFFVNCMYWKYKDVEPTQDFLS